MHTQRNPNPTRERDLTCTSLLTDSASDELPESLQETMATSCANVQGFKAGDGGRELAAGDRGRGRGRARGWRMGNMKEKGGLLREVWGGGTGGTGTSTVSSAG